MMKRRKIHNGSRTNCNNQQPTTIALIFFLNNHSHALSMYYALCTLYRGGAKKLMSGLDPDMNLCQGLMSGSHVGISCRDQMCIFQLDFPFLLLSISQYLAICIYHCPFQFDFPFLLRSISQNWNSAFTNAFLGWIS